MPRMVEARGEVPNAVADGADPPHLFDGIVHGRYFPPIITVVMVNLRLEECGENPQ